jgi:HAD superfamily phosphoserine phosphatase-like hydrolase
LIKPGGSTVSTQHIKMNKKFAAFDIDGSLIRWQLYHAIADNLVKLGFIAPVKFQEIKDARMVWKRRENSESFKQYEVKLVELYGEILSEVTYEQFLQSADAVFEEYKDQVYIYTRDLIKQLKQEGYLLFAISGSQKEIIKKMVDYYGFDDFASSVYEHENNHFTGKLTTPILNKDEVLKELAAKHGAGFDGSIVVGGSAGDSKMLDLAEQPIAFNPEVALFKIAQQKGWKVVVERKNIFYELEGKDGKYQLVKTNLG